MKKAKKFFILFIAAVIFTAVYSASAFAADDPDIQANAVYLLETNTNTVFYSKNADGKIYPASTTKIMTCLLAIEAVERGEVSLSDVVTASDTYQYDLVSDGSTQNIQPGEEMTLENLLYCALVASANEACNIIGEYICDGDISAFIDLMNERAEELGCTGTNFANTHGLPNENHYTTAYDLALIAREALEHETFVTICSTVSYTVPATNLSEERELTTTNKLMISDSTYYYEYASGIKTGTTSAAGYCLISTAEKDGLSLLAVVMGASSVIAEDGTTEVQSFTESKRLYEWAFSSFSYRTILSTTELIAELPVSMGDGADSVVVCPAEDITVLLDNDIDVDTDIIRTITIYPTDDGSDLMAPIDEGTALGEITLSYNGSDLATIKLLANTSIDLSKSEYMKSRIKETLSQTWIKVAAGVILLIFVLYIILVIRYNYIRKRRREAAKLRRQKELEQQRAEAAKTYKPSTGKSFEDIYDKYNR